MDYHPLGSTGIEVSSLCFGILPMGPLQAGLPVEEGGALILEGLERGINFVDTAEMYRTYPHLRWALRRFGGPAVIATKSMAMTYGDMKRSVETARNELKRDRIDIFHLHAARDSDPVVNRAGAFEALIEAKREGAVGAIGVACHSVHGIMRSARVPEVDVLFLLINRAGLGILDGDAAAMISAVAGAQAAGKGVYAMKALAGGNLLGDIRENISFVRKEAGVPVIAVGMVRRCELLMNLALFENRPVPDEVLAEANPANKKVMVMFFCTGCGSCVEACHSDAITIVENRAVIDGTKCLLCGYCSSACPEFAIRVV